MPFALIRLAVERRHIHYSAHHPIRQARKDHSFSLEFCGTILRSHSDNKVYTERYIAGMPAFAVVLNG
jgi:hypothetical protein